MDEELRRRRAMAMLKEGRRVVDVCTALGRSREWIAKWRRRSEAEGPGALRGRSRAPQHQARQTSPAIERAVLAARDRLERRIRGREFAGIGADAVAWELELAHVAPLPARRTIERILQRRGRTARTRPPERTRPPAAYPAVAARAAGDLHETDLVGPRHLRTPGRPVRFFSFHTLDVAGGGVATDQFPDKGAESFCGHLAAAWARLGLPRTWQLDNERTVAGFSPRARPPFTQPLRLALLLGVEVRFIPDGEPGRNADVESFNDLWQERVLRRFDCPGLGRLRAVSGRFERWFMEARPHPKLRAAEHGTRFPAQLLASLDGALPRLPAGFTLDAYREEGGELRLPLARGRISWVRRVDEHGGVWIAGEHLRIKRAANEYVVGTLSTGRREVVVRHGERIVSRFAFRIDERVVRSLRRGG
ncbi:MAG: helix-turn-helix domain-containing protein [Chloroflexota bacterium]|nr:helix-turn-helix domain-containing protein [Chloroflexota bacterium]